MAVSGPACCNSSSALLPHNPGVTAFLLASLWADAGLAIAEH